MNTQTQQYTKRQTLNEIKKASYNLAYVLNNQTWSALWDNYLKENVDEEKKHDNYRSDGISRGITIREAGKLFAVKQIVEYLEGAKAPDVKAYLNMRKSVFTAYALAMNYTKQINEALEGIDLDIIRQADYCKLIEV